MKKKWIIGLGVFVFLIISLVSLPFIFKGKILARIDMEIAESVNAQVFYDYENISLSLFRRFPNISATISDFGIVGNSPFQNDTLVQLDRLHVDFNLRSVIFDEYPQLTGVLLDGGALYVKILEDGTANYDITVPTEEMDVAESNFKIGVDLIEVNNLDLIYDDRPQKILLALGAINAEGKGDFTESVYDLPLKMEAMISNLTYEEVNYLQNKNFKGETILNVDMEKMRFAFGEGNFSINDFLFDLTGYLAMPADDIEFDLAFAGKENTFKSILSLVPGIYTADFSSLKTSGTMDFKGFFKGIYNEEKFPSFDIALNITDGMFQYPDLPRPVNNVNLEMQIKNPTDNLDNTSINIPAFNLDFGSNPISGRFFLANLLDYEIDGAMIGKLNLEELTSIFPIEGMALKGILDVNAQAKGKYDSIAKIIPTIDAKLLLSDGFVKSFEFPAPIEGLHVVATVLNTSGKMDDFVVDLSTFGFELEDEAIEGRMKISDFDKLNWDGAIKGAVDLAKILAIFPMEDMTMSGKVNANIQTKGSYEAVKEKRYNALDTRGTMAVSNFSYLSSDFPQGVKILQAKADFTPERVNLSEFESRLGESPVQATGFLSNYMNYILGENETLKGQLSLNSSKFNVNEWMSSSVDTTSSESEVLSLPKNIDFAMSVSAGEVLYDNLELKNVRGNMILRDGILTFSDAAMQTLGGEISLDGSYDPTDLADPKFDFNLNLADISIPQAFQSFTTIQAFAPIAQNLKGLFNSSLNFSGSLGQNMMPILSSLDGKGLVKIAQTALQDSKILEQITKLTKLNDANTLLLKNLLISITINEGVMNVKPFDVKLWDYQANIQGSAGFDGTINYLLKMEVPAGKFGAQANSILATISGTQTDENSMIPLALNLSGTYKSPKISLAGGNSIETLLTNALKSRVSNESEKIQDMATEQFKAAQDSLKQSIQVKTTAIQDSVKKEVEKKIGETQNKAVDEAKTLLKGLLKPKPQPVKPDTTAVKDF